jgi:hypothetical protein
MTEQLTFTEQESKDCYGFTNFVFENAVWNINTKQAFELVKLYQSQAALSKKVEKHIMEFKESTPPPDKKSRRKRT